jgi:UDP-N-acetylenolpyruvoylglucosamine reductase
MLEIAGATVREEEPIARHLPLRASPGTFERWVEVDDEVALLAVIRAARAEKLAIRPMGPFVDALPSEGGLAGVALRLGSGFEGIEAVSGGLRVGASVPMALVGLRRGFETLRGAPGCLLDAWEEGWIAPALVSVRRFRGRGFEEVADAQPDPKSLVVSAVLRPGVRLSPPRAGTAFREVGRRGIALRELCVRCGLRGLRLFGALFAEEDAAVLVNRGDATPRQLRLLLVAARERVAGASGVNLEERMAAPGRGGRL